jgi:hypothetical protein
VCDLLRDLLLNEDSDNAGLVPEGAREELLWRTFTHLVLGGACCQYEVCVGGGGGGGVGQGRVGEGEGAASMTWGRGRLSGKGGPWGGGGGGCQYEVWEGQSKGESREEGTATAG